MAEAFKQILARVVERMRPMCEERDAWSVAEEFVPQMPVAFRDALAAEYLVIAYFRDDKDRELRKPTPRKRRSPKRARSADPAYTDEEAAIESRFWTNVTKAVDDFKAAVKAEITAELLAEAFTLPDGSQVTWGEATSDQHRLASLDHQLTAGEHLQAATRHEVAITMLEQAGAVCLAQCVPVAIS